MTPGNCPTCGASLRDGARFCPACGTAVPAGAADHPERVRVQPRWRINRRRAAIATVAVVLVAGATFVGYELTTDSGSPPEYGAIDPGNTADPPCDEKEAEAQLRSGPFAEAIHRQLDVPRSSSPADLFISKLVACADLTGDGEVEMVIQGLGPTGGAVNPWAIFTPENGRWALAVARPTIPIESLTIVDGSVHEVSPVYGPDDPLCCPSGSRSGYVTWNGGSFEYEPDQGSTDRLIHLAADGTAERLGNLDLNSANLRAARASLGPPSEIGAKNLTECLASWNDLGLDIYFENLNGSGACGPAGRIGRVEIGGGPGAQAGWVVDGGMRIGTPLRQALESYPDAYRENRASDEGCSGSLYVLQTAPVAGTLPSLLIHAQQGEIACIELNVFAAGV